jgi:hypothetical protein
VNSAGYIRTTQRFAASRFAPFRWVFQDKDLAFYDLSNEIKINMGMNKNEVEKLLGQPIDTIGFLGIFEYPGLQPDLRSLMKGHFYETQSHQSSLLFSFKPRTIYSILRASFRCQIVIGGSKTCLF